MKSKRTTKLKAPRRLAPAHGSDAVVLRLLDDNRRMTRELLAYRKAKRINAARLLLCKLRAHIEPHYKAEHGIPLKYDTGWAWEMAAFIENHFQKITVKQMREHQNGTAMRQLNEKGKYELH
jgi:hypothetical protein